MISGPFRRDKICRNGLDFTTYRRPGGIFINIVQTGYDPDHISVHCRNRNIKSDGSYCAGHIRTNSTDFTKLLRILRQVSVKITHHLSGSREKVPGTGIITQTFPILQDIRLICFSKGSESRKTGKETAVIGKSCFHTRLLKHCFTDPGPV